MANSSNPRNDKRKLGKCKVTNIGKYHHIQHIGLAILHLIQSPSGNGKKTHTHICSYSPTIILQTYPNNIINIKQHLIWLKIPMSFSATHFLFASVPIKINNEHYWINQIGLFLHRLTSCWFIFYQVAQQCRRNAKYNIVAFGDVFCLLFLAGCFCAIRPVPRFWDTQPNPA